MSLPCLVINSYNVNTSIKFLHSRQKGENKSYSKLLCNFLENLLDSGFLHNISKLQSYIVNRLKWLFVKM